ncbi:MAG: universal stress protein [Proteobacteria bacterium]|nr:universal stress protein [Pseudomonadota bacterium]MBU1388795.1 universal stress protein [Pseudomonadota bacterium]MBU1543136.1 universal stress protein [Pseudomonadota bacterium]MBU2481726.1 universal stress protein [Pseudomonadota bacterium]
MKILLGCKEGRVSNNVLEVAVKHAKAFDAQIMIVTSMIGGDKTEKDQIIKAEKSSKLIKESLDKEGVQNEVHLLVRGMEPGEDIVRFAKEKKVDQIIIGVKNRSKVGKLIFGSAAQVVILEAKCPVLAVK